MTRPHRMLISYHYARRIDMEAAVARFPERPKVFANSGAFSALTLGAPIDVVE